METGLPRPRKRFAEATEDEIQRKKENMHSTNTVKCNRKAANTLKSYLKEKGQDIRFENYDDANLNDVLSYFYLEARRPDGEMYKSSTLENFRHSLNRYLNAPPFNRGTDIIKDPTYRDANVSFKAAMAELKREGKGVIDHHAIIADADISKLYMSQYLSIDTPTRLMQKVQFDVRLYFFRRGGENMSSMTKATFAIKTDPDSGLRYVCKQIDELTKNHRETDKENNSGVMPEIRGSDLCPMLSFDRYLKKLHPECDRLWQRPRDSFTDSDIVWYCNVPIGEKTLANFMSYLSAKCELSKKYTNHSIRATDATVLSRSQFGGQHKSCQCRPVINLSLPVRSINELATLRR